MADGTIRTPTVVELSVGTMLIVLSILGAAIAVGFAAHGSLRPFATLPIHWWGAAPLGLVIPILPLPAGASPDQVRLVLAVSYALLLGFAWVNRRLPAMPVVLLGLALNALVVVANGGMPVSADAARAAGTIDALPTMRGGPEKHHLMTDQDVLRPLGDVISVPEPVGALFSVGDVFLYGGLSWLVVMVMLGRSGENRRPPSRWFQGYRGQHLRQRRRSLRKPSSRDPGLVPPVAAARSGTAP
jgi:hypothetical protein